MKNKREPYKLGDALFNLFMAMRADDKVAVEGYVLEILANTGIGSTTLAESVKEAGERGETIAQLRYRIIGNMQKRKVDTSFII